MEEQYTELNQNVIDLQDSQEVTNDLLEDIQQILLDQDEKDSIKADQEQENAQATRDADQQQADTYTELLTNIDDHIDLTNHLLVGNMFFICVLIGVLIGKIIWDRFIKL